MVITMAHASTHGARKPPGPKVVRDPNSVKRQHAAGKGVSITTAGGVGLGVSCS